MDQESYEEINLFELVEILLKRWKLIIAFTLLAMVAAVGFTVVQPPSYESGFSLIVAGDIPFTAVDEVLKEQPYEFIDELSILGKVYNPQGILNSTSIESDENARYLSVTVSNSDGEVARKIASLWLDGFLGDIEELLKDQPVKTMTTAKENYNQSLAEYLEYSSDRNSLIQRRDYLSAKIETVEKNLIDSEERKNQIALELSVSKAKLAEITPQMQNLKPVIVLTKPVVGPSGTMYEEVQEVNPLFQSLETQKFDLEQNIAALEEEQRQVIDLVEERTRLQNSLRAELQEVHNKLDKLESLLGSSQEQASYWEQQLQEANNRLETIEGGSQVTIVRDVTEPEEEDNQKLLLNAAIAGFLGLFASIFMVLVLNYWNEYKNQSGAAV